LSGKIKAFDRRGHVAKLCIVFLPLLFASLVGISRVDDYWHHWQDVFAGGLLGWSTLSISVSSESSKPQKLLPLLLTLYSLKNISSFRAYSGYILLFAVFSASLSF